MPTGPLFSPDLAPILSSKSQATFIPGRPGTHPSSLSIRSKKTGPVSEAGKRPSCSLRLSAFDLSYYSHCQLDRSLHKPPSSKRPTPTPSNPSSSDSDEKLKPSPSKKVKSLLFDKAKGLSFDKAKGLSVIREGEDSEDTDPIGPRRRQRYARKYSESPTTSPQPRVSEVGKDEGAMSHPITVTQAVETSS